MRGLRHAFLACTTLAALAVSAGTAAAQLVRPFTSRYTTTTNGDLTIVANTLLTCSGGGCASAQGGGNADNDDFAMVHVDVDGDPTTFNSSEATLTLPAGATVAWAGLYWGASSSDPARGSCRLTRPGGGSGPVAASQLDAQGSVYSAFAEVTAQVRASGSGTYGVANVQADTGVGRHAGWTLVVVYELASEPLRWLTVRDGFANVTGAASAVSIPLSGYVTPSAGLVRRLIGALVYDGDAGQNGDRFQLNGVSQGDGTSSSSNPFNSSVAILGSHFTAKTPNYQNQLGLDADIFAIAGVLPSGSSSQTLTFTTSGDAYWPAAAVFAIDMYAPVIEGSGFTKTFSDVNGAPTHPGDLLDYTIVLRNTGNDEATQAVMRDTLPANLAYVPNSLVIVDGPNAGAKTDAAGDDQAEYVSGSRTVVARLGAGATATSGGTLAAGAQTTVRFRVRVVQPTANGTIVANQASASFAGAQFGTVFVTRSDGDPVASGIQPTTTTVVAAVPSGTVFEDANYGGGAGRSQAVAAGVGRPGARVELYAAGGAFVAATTTDAAGRWAFDGWAPGSYTVRVVSSSVTSARPGAVATLVPVQTWRTTGAGGVATGDPDRVGGEDPALPDAAANLTAAALPTLTTAAARPHSIAPVDLGSTDVPGLDFGYSFDVITNVRETGQGSLRQFIVNANTLGNAGLAQAGQAPGVEASIFMVPGPVARPGLRAGLASPMQSGVVRLGATIALPAITGAFTSIDGTTQTAGGGDTNPAWLGTVGAAGVDGLALAGVAAPEVELVDGAGLPIGLDVQAADVTLRGITVLGFGNAVASDAHADVRVGAGAARFRAEGVVLGTSSLAFVAPAAGLRSGGDHLRVVGAAAGTVRGSLIGHGAGNGIALGSGAAGWTIEGSEIAGNAFGAPARDGIAVGAGGGHLVRGNRIAAQDGPGVDLVAATASCTLENNTIAGNGIGAVGTAETPGVRVGGDGHRLDRNVLQGNYGAGALLTAGTTNAVLTRNATYGNGTIANRFGGGPTGQLGIDLLRSTDDPAKGTAPFVTKNDAGDADAGANGLLNFPVLESAVVGIGNLTVAGWARPGSTIELFLTDADPSGFGEGQAYATTVVEGSAADLDATSSSYAPPVNGLDQGSDVTNRFRFVVPLPPGVAPGRSLTATATLAGVGTSEFGGRVLVGGGVPVTGFVYADGDHDATRDAGESGAGVATWVKLVAVSAPAAAQQVASADPGTGAYGFAQVAEGDYTLVLDDNSNVADVTPTPPAGRIVTEAAPGTRPATVPGLGGLANQDFGLWHGGRVEGRVFRDDGAGAAGGAGANDGLVQAGEPGVAGVELELRAAACAGGACDTTRTDGGGAFALWFPASAGGAAAQVVERNPAGWLSVSGFAGTTGGAYARATDALSFTATSGTIAGGVLFGDVPPNAFAAAGAASVAPGGVALYPHAFTAASAGAVTFGSVRAPSPPIAGWGHELVRDLDCDGVIDAGEPVIDATPVALVAGERVCLVARHTAPAGAVAGATELATLTAAFSYANVAPALAAPSSLTELTTVLVSGGGLVLSKSVDRTTALPGELLTYTITYTNLSNAPLTAIVINDATPAFTVFEDATCGAPGDGLSACGVSVQPSAGAAGPVSWALAGALAPGGTGTVTFRVRVQ